MSLRTVPQQEVTVHTHEEPREMSAAARLSREVWGVWRAMDWRRAAWVALAVVPDFELPGVRARMLRWVGSDIRRGVSVFGAVEIVGPRHAQRNLRVGQGSVIAPGVVLCLDAPITLGKNVSIGPRAMLYTATHSLGTSSRRMDPAVVARPIVIEDGAWIGLGAMILPGVRIGRGAVVAAGAVVTIDVPPHSLVAGNPATVTQQLPDR